jgi:phosphoribosyl-AMP cyclohydrolase
MLAYMNELALQKTIETGKVHYWSRSRGKLWLKGETSGHVQLLRALFLDCDEDAILVKVEQVGAAACHTGHISCFYRKFDGQGFVPQGKPVFDPKEVYKK